MRITDFKTDEPLTIYNFSDTHIGAVCFAEKKLKEHIEMCREEGAYWTHNGDWLEGITPDDRRYMVPDDDKDKTLSTLAQIDHALELFEPLKGKGLASLSGNHEMVLARKIGDVGKRIARRLDTPYLGELGYLNLKVMGQNIPILLWHGAWGGELRGAKANRQHRQSHKFRAKIYLTGHWHTWDPYQDSQHYIKRNKIYKYKRYYISLPSYYDTYANGGNYAQSRAYYDGPIGCCKLTLTDKSIKYELIE